MKKVTALLTAFVLTLPILGDAPRSAAPPALAAVPALTVSQAETDAIKIDGGDAVLKDVVVYVPKIEKVWVVNKLPFDLSVPADGVDYEWTWPEGVKAHRKRSKLTITDAPKGELRVGVSWALIDFKADRLVPKSAAIIVHVGDVTPPVPPVPPDPKPPVPPIPVGGLRVIFVNESSAPMTKEQLNIWNSTRIAAYLTDKCVKDGAQPAYRKWDKDIKTDFEPPAMRQLWADSKAQATASLPSVVIAVGQKAVVYPFPATEDEMLVLLRKHAEGK